uniref:Uncharacterized protein n=1 Tax=Globodera pallida TaxID=36090 RepID=A0A183CEE5_GLOPA
MRKFALHGIAFSRLDVTIGSGGRALWTTGNKGTQALISPGPSIPTRFLLRAANDKAKSSPAATNKQLCIENEIRALKDEIRAMKGEIRALNAKTWLATTNKQPSIEEKMLTLDIITTIFLILCVILLLASLAYFVYNDQRMMDEKEAMARERES